MNNDAQKIVCSENFLNWMKSDVHYSYSLKSKFPARAYFIDHSQLKVILQRNSPSPRKKVLLEKLPSD